MRLHAHAAHTGMRAMYSYRSCVNEKYCDANTNYQYRYRLYCTL